LTVYSASFFENKEISLEYRLVSRISDKRKCEECGDSAKLAERMKECRAAIEKIQ
jgi:formylmethanofuran dehydrogenase subunit E